MKRVLAGIVALSLIGAGFFINSKRTDPERGRGPLQLWCVADAAEVCRAVESGRVVVTIASPLLVEASLDAGKAIDAVVSSPAWLKRLDDRAKLRVQSPLVSAPIVVAARKGERPCADLICLIQPMTRAALPSIETLSASIVAAGGTKSVAVDDIPTAIVDHLRSRGAGTAGIEPLTALVSTRLIDAVVTVSPSTVGVAGIAVRPVTPPAVLELDLGWVTEDKRLDDLGRRFIQAGRKQGWDGPSESTPGPDSTAVIDAYGILNS